MLENNFDKEIRNKLESIEPKFKPEAWKKLKKSLPIPWYVSFFKTYGGWLFGGVSTALLLFSSLNDDLKEPSFLSNSSIEPQTTENVKYDTVYIKQTDTLFLNNTIVKKIYIDNPANNNEHINNIEFANKSNNISKNNVVVSKTNEDNIKSGIENTLDYKKLYEELIVQNTMNEANQPITPIVDEDLKEDKKIADTPKIAELALTEKTLENPASKKFKLKDLNARFGINSNYLGNNLFSLGPEIEVFLNQRISIGTSLQLTGHKDINYSVPREFNVGTGKEFEVRYDKFIKEKPQRIENISIKTSMIRLPVFLTYYVPINYKFSFLINTGTRLNLNVSESVTFTGERFGVKSKSNFDSQYKPAVFNNLYYGTGIQYQYNRMYAQISPYFEFSFNRNSYLIPPKKFGINASVKFGIGN